MLHMITTMQQAVKSEMKWSKMKTETITFA